MIKSIRFLKKIIVISFLVHTTGFLQAQLINMKEETKNVLSVAFSPDGTKLVSGGMKNKIELWDVLDQSLIRDFEGHQETKNINCVKFSIDGSKIFTASADFSIIEWDIKNGNLIRTFSGHTGSVNSIAVTPDGTKIATGSDDRTIRLWDLNNEKSVKTFTGHNGEIYSVAFSPDGKTLASGGEDKTIKIWDINDGKIIETLTGHSLGISSLAFSPDGTLLVSGSRDNKIKLWDLNKKSLISTLAGHTLGINVVAFSHNGKRLASGGDNTTIIIWDMSDYNIILSLRGLTRSIYGIDFSPNDEYLATAGGDGLRLWNLKEEIRKIRISDIKGKITDISGNPIEAEISIIDLDNDKIINHLKSNLPDGGFIINKLQYNKKYKMIIQKKGFEVSSQGLDLNETRETDHFLIKLTPNKPLQYQISGIILDESGNPLEAELKFKDNLTGETINKSKTNSMKGNFSISIPGNKTYQFIIEKSGFDPITGLLDLKKDTSENINFTNPIKMFPHRAIISGTILDSKGTPLNADIKFDDLSKNETILSTKSNPVDGTFEAKIPLGKYYGFYAEKTGYFPVSDTIDLRKKTISGDKIIKNLTLTSIQEMKEKGLTVRINNIFFESGKFELDPKSYPELSRLAKILKENQDTKVEISGHTDNVGSEESNILLSKKRATAVENYLIIVGCKPKNIISKGFGSSKSVETNETEQGRAMNRRVEFKFVKK